MVYNGEVFNYIELREELIKAGYSFKTTSDTEVVIIAFHAWKEACFSKFNGMWSLVIYDKSANRLYISRDRFGQKPLYVMQKDNAIFFASEVQQLLACSDSQPDYEVIQQFLKEGCFESNGRTFFKSIEMFPKAHYAIVNSNGQIIVGRYWDYWNGKVEEADEKCFDEFNQLLENSIKIRLRADVPYGIILSGGVDSTIISAYTREIDGYEKSISAFTYSSQDMYDESIYAKEIAKKLNISLTLQTQDEDPVEYTNRLKKIVKHMGRGHSSPAIISIDYLYEAVHRANIKIALDGQGADELLAGYEHYFPLIIPVFLLKANFKQAFLFLKEFFKRGFFSMTVCYLRVNLPEYCKKIGRILYGYERFFKNYDSSEMPSSFNKLKKRSKNKNFLNRFLIWQHDIGLEHLLFYGDIVAMKNSVENRSPFMDHRLVDLVFKYSEKLKLWDGINKYALKQLPIYGNFRQELNRKKIGFSSDIKLKTKQYMTTELKKSEILKWSIFSAKLRKHLNEGLFEQPKYERLLFRLYQVHLWNDIFQVKE